MFGFSKKIEPVKKIFNPAKDQDNPTSSFSIPSNKQLLLRLNEISSFVKNNLKNSMSQGRSELKDWYTVLLNEIIGSAKNSDHWIISYVANDWSQETIDIVNSLCELLIPNESANLFKFAFEGRRDPSTNYHFPVESLPQHTQILIKNGNYNYISEVYINLGIPWINQIENIKTSGCLLLNSWEIFLFTFFSKISKLSNKNENIFLNILHTKWMSEFSNSDFLIEQIISNYDLFLFAKYYLYLFEVAKYSSDDYLYLFTNLIVEYFLNPINLVHEFNRTIDIYEEEQAKSYQMGIQGPK